MQVERKLHTCDETKLLIAAPALSRGNLSFRFQNGPLETRRTPRFAWRWATLHAASSMQQAACSSRQLQKVMHYWYRCSMN